MKKFQAILFTLVTVVIAIVGFSGYSDGSHYIEWFGIELSKNWFLIFILVFAVIDFFTLKSAFGKDKFIEEMKDKALQTGSLASEMENPCTISLTRPGNILGAAMGVRVFLNSVEQEVLKNGSTIFMKTELIHNELTVRYNADDAVRSINFDATPGGNVNITLKYVGAKLIIEDEMSS